MENDYTLLRPFDLEAAKAGEPICWGYCDSKVAYVGVSGKGGIAYDSERQAGFTHSSSLRMAPLYWIEHKPVYKGDTLYYLNGTHGIEVTGYKPHVKDNSGLLGKVVFSKVDFIPNGSVTWAPFNMWTWAKPVTKVKKEGWINIYPFNSIHSQGLQADTGFVYATEGHALKQVRSRSSATTIRIEWEEEAK